MSWVLDQAFIAYFLLANGLYAMLVALSFADLIRRRGERMPELHGTVLGDHGTPPVTVIAPAYNEEKTIVASVRSFLQLEYPELQVIVVNDGSRDDTLQRLRDSFELEPTVLGDRHELPTSTVLARYRSRSHPGLVVIDKINGGKADALNVGLNHCTTPLFCGVDADTIVERQALLRMVEPFLYDERRVAAVGGTVRVVNGCSVADGQLGPVQLPSSWLARFQIVEYLRAFGLGRMGFNRLGGTLIISGAFGMFRRDAVVATGGYRVDTVGEDMDLVVRLHRAGLEQGRCWALTHIPDPVCFTEVPETLAVLGAQRDRWQRGLADVLAHNTDMLLNPRFGRLGMFVVPAFVVVELLGAPIELAGYLWFVIHVGLGTMAPAVAALYFVVAFLLGFAISMQCLIMDDLHAGHFRGWRQRAVLALVALLEGFGYRQLVLAYRVRGMLGYLTGDRSWGTMTRQGFDAASAK